MPAPATLPYDTASWGRRVLALLVDWVASTLVVVVFVGWDSYSAPGSSDQWLTLLVFVIESALFTTTVGGSFGKMACRLRVVRVDGGGRLDPLRSLARAILVAVVIPPLVFRPDRRGLHDLAAGTATVTLQVAHSQHAA
ncbi:RDD family protein [Nocardioides mangrovi]|uniref:RDD family protein n=1 Tax=Nocardioides mangrovi TaxID=2874580 RepID=A0ABS7UHM7_9ACTN|nr:RDD family protein [Nocardioides mangrovi]MBZ5740339.1 RDD family protein [Nocardioides mangrovi]